MTNALLPYLSLVGQELSIQVSSHRIGLEGPSSSSGGSQVESVRL